MGYIFGAGTQYRTPEELAKARAILEAMEGPSRAPQSVGEGLAVVGQAIRRRRDLNAIGKAETAGRESAAPISNALIAALSGKGAYPEAPSAAPMNESDLATQRVAQAFGDSQPEAGGDIASYIRQAAGQRGIDPETAIRVAMSEGGVKDPFRQSDFVKGGVREQSYGPFQLFMGGGLGNEAMKAGIDPRKDWKGGVDFALDQAAKGGWGPWYGAKRIGVTGMEGIGNAPQPSRNAAVAGALNASIPAMAGGGYSDTDPAGGPSAELLWRALGNEFVPGAQRQLAAALLGKKMDPEADLDRRYKEAQIEHLGADDYKVVDKRLLKIGPDGVSDATPGGEMAADFDDTAKLRTELHQLPSFKNLSQAAPIYQSMAETAGRNTRASDLNLVYGLGKIMDPTSVVREGEMVMVKNTASLPDWLQGAIASLNGGAALTPDTRNAIMTEAFGRVKGYQDAFGQDAQMYRGIVQRNRMNEADVIPTFGEMNPWQPTVEAAQPPGGGAPQVNEIATPQTDEEFNALPSGTIFQDPEDKKFYRKP